MKLDSIQFLRAVAATLVVYAHSIDLTMQFGKSRQESFHYLNDVGCIGVDLFFVISGFIITYVARKYSGVGEGLGFLQKRFYRINPIYYIASVLFLGSLLLQIWVVNKVFYFVPEEVFQSAIDTVLILPATNNQVLFRPFLMIGWTLAFEWLFYILFFVTILSRVKRKIVLLTVVIVVLIAMRYVIQPLDLRLTILTNPIMLEFLLGVIICQLYLQGIKIPVYLSVIFLVIGLAGYIILVFHNNPLIAAVGPILDGSLSMARFLYWGIPSGFITTGCIFLEQRGKLNRLWDNKLTRLVGDASYSVYLVHLTAFALLTILYKQVGFFLPPDLSIFFQVLVALGVSIAFYWWIEKPLLRWLHKPSKKPVATEPSVPVPHPQAT